MSERPLWRVKVACVDSAGRNIVSNQYVHASDPALAIKAAILRVSAMGARQVDGVVMVTRGRFLSDDVQLAQVHALITYHKEAWSEGYSAACAKHGIEEDSEGTAHE